MNFELAHKGRAFFLAFTAKTPDEGMAFADKQINTWGTEPSGSVLRCLDDGAVRIRTQKGWESVAKVAKR